MQEFVFRKLTYFTIFARVASFACARIAARQIVRADDADRVETRSSRGLPGPRRERRRHQ